jgi:hypothetical protein
MMQHKLYDFLQIPNVFGTVIYDSLDAFYPSPPFYLNILVFTSGTIEIIENTLVATRVG